MASSATSRTPSRAAGRLASIVFADLLIALRFFSRLPVPETARERALGPAGLARATPLVPLAGALIGLVPALVLLAAEAVALPAAIAAPLAIAALVLVTGALHEDALADCADGFGGGGTRARKLEIMRDSRIGTYGACAIALSLYLRAAALAVVMAHGVGSAVAVVIAAAALSRAASLLPLVLLPPARDDGVGLGAGRPGKNAFAVSVALAIAVATGVLWTGAGLGSIIVAVGLAALVALSFCALARRQVGGYTGDVAGATQQLVEIAVYLVFAAG